MLVVLSTHPIQYQAPIWRSLAARGRVPIHVMYMDPRAAHSFVDPGFGRPVAWDIDLLAGYSSEVVGLANAGKADSFLSLRVPRDFGQRLRALGATALWVQGWQVAGYWQAIRTARAAGIEVWLRGETNARSGRGGRLRPVKRLLLRHMLASVDRLLCIGEANRAFYTAMGLAPARMVSAPYCVDNDRFRAQASVLRSDRIGLRRKWRIADDAFCVLFAGKFVAKKRPMDLVRACQALAAASGRAVHILWVGSGELGGELRRATTVAYDADRRSTESVVERATHGVTASFAGFLNQSEIAQAYVAADCLALPSDANETWGLVVNEAMASGLPCVVSEACGCADDLIVPTRPDLAFPVGAIDAFAGALGEAMRNPPSATSLRRVIDRYDYAHTVNTVEALYARRVGAGPAEGLAVA